MGIFEITVGLISSMFLVLVFLLPGLLPTWISGTFGSGRRSTVFNTITTLFIFSSLPYAILAIFYEWVDKKFPLPIWGTNFLKFTTETETPTQTQTLGSESSFSLAIENFSLFESLNAIAWSMLISLGILCISLLVYRKRLIVGGLHYFRLSDHFGEKDVWTNQLTEVTKSRSFVRITDLAKRIIFTGWILEFSEYDNFRELLLEEVEVRDFNDILISKSETTYLGFPNDNIWIDFSKRRKENAKCR